MEKIEKVHQLTLFDQLNSAYTRYKLCAVPEGEQDLAPGDEVIIRADAGTEYEGCVLFHKNDIVYANEA